jgi:putative Mg2+ transporter-C (MgtC) family protein
MSPLDILGIKEMALRLTVAVIVGGLLGLNRELHGKPAGFSTNALVALGAAIVATLALQVQGDLVVPDENSLGRIVQGTLAGIGFLGAGVIMRDTPGHVSGLTTAATIWICAAIGLLCGLGYWNLVAVATILVLAVLVLGHSLERISERIFRRSSNKPPDSRA